MPSEPLGVFWLPAGLNIPDIGTKALVDVTDGDTPTIQMPIRMLSVDTPEVTARTAAVAKRTDQEFVELASWIEAGRAPVSARFAAYIMPKLKTGTAGTLQFTAGTSASAWLKAETARRLTKPDGSKRKLFVRVSEAPFDNFGRLLAYIAPNFDANELATLSRDARETFNQGLVGAGWAAPFILYPNIPGQLDLPGFIEKAVDAFEAKSGQWSDPLAMPGYEYRMCEKLYDITKKLVAGTRLSTRDRLEWRSRYCADLRTRQLFGPEDYMLVPVPYRLWFWPDDIQEAVGKLNLVPAPSLVEV